MRKPKPDGFGFFLSLLYKDKALKVNPQLLSVPISGKIIALCWSNLHHHQVYALTQAASLLLIDTTTGSIVAEHTLPWGDLDWEKPVQVALSSQDQFLCLANDYDQYGYVFDLHQGEVSFKLDRGTYHTIQTKFPTIFFRKEGKEYLIHAADWNHIDITELATQTLITQRDTNQYEKEGYLDYFYGELHLSPNQQWLLSSGWVWNPVSVIKFINLEKWFYENKAEPEQNQEANFGIVSYYWDRAICWVGNTTVAYFYDPREEELEEDACEEQGIRPDQSYLFLYDVRTREMIKRIEFWGFSQNQYHEATPDCGLFFRQHLIASSRQRGTFVIDLAKEAIIYQNPDLYLEHFQSAFGIFYCLKEENVIEYTQFEF